MVSAEGWLGIGTAILVAFIVAFRVFERSWTPPALLFVFSFYSAAYLYSYFIWIEPTRYGAFIYGNFELAWSLATGSFAALLAGYLAHAVWRRRAPPRSEPPAAPWMTPRTAAAVAIALAATIAFSFFYAWSTGGFSILPSVGRPASSWFYRAGTVSFFLQTPLTLALLLGAPSLPEADRRRYMALAWVAAAAIILLSLLLLRRQGAVTLIVALLIVVHHRIRPLRVREIVGVACLLFVVQLVHGLRTAGIPLDQMGFQTILGYLYDVSIVQTIKRIAAPLQGWDVFTSILAIVPDKEQFRYGATYAESFLSLARPRVLGLSSLDPDTPAHWYQGVWTRHIGTEGVHVAGADFSMLSEAYLNFGPAMFLVFLPVGALVGSLSRTIRLSSSGPWAFASLIVLLVLTSSLRSDSNTLFKGAVFGTVPVVLMIYASRRLDTTLTARPPGASRREAIAGEARRIVANGVGALRRWQRLAPWNVRTRER